MHRRTAAALIVGGGLAAVLGGCGQKGPLYLPEEKLEELKRKKDALGKERDAPDGGQPPAQAPSG